MQNEEFKVEEKIGDKALKELLLNLKKEEECIKNNEMLTEKDKEQELKNYENLRFMLQRIYNQIKELKMQGDHIFWPSKTKPKRDNVFEAVTYFRAIFKETFGEYRWDLIEEIIMAYCPEVFKGGNIESWYYKRKKEDFKYWPMKVEDREKFFLESLRKDFNY